jgi:hypothetical protein
LRLDYILKRRAYPWKALENLPENFEAAYHDVMERIKQGGSEEDAIAVLSWVHRALRLLTMDELREALSVNLGQKSLKSSRLPIAHKLIDICEGLVICLPNGIVQFAHITVQEFLQLHCQSQLLSNAYIARICLTYFGFKEFNAVGVRGTHQFMRYVEEYLGDHTRGVERDPDVQKTFFSVFRPKGK